VNISSNGISKNERAREEKNKRETNKQIIIVVVCSVTCVHDHSAADQRNLCEKT
jgi:hypothetical protein